MKEWYSAAELAGMALPGLPGTESATIRRAKAKNWRSRPRGGRGGGLEYHVSALPSTAQITLTLAAKARTGAEAIPAEPAAADRPDRDTLWGWYDAATEKKKAEAKRRLDILDAVEVLYRNGLRRDAAVMSVAAHHKVGVSTVYTWMKLVEGRDRADWLPALAPRHTGRIATVECAPEAWDMLRSDYLRHAAPPFSDCYERMKRAADAQGWAVPSERTLLRRLHATVHPAVVAMCREGTEAVKRMYPAQERDRTHFHALEAINGDGHRWDVWVQWPDGEVARPNMVAFQDLYSGMILSWRVDRTANSWAVRLAIGDLVETWGIPRKVWLDNGRDFASKWLTGGTPNRYRFTVRDEDPVGILTQLLGPENIHWTTPYSGQSKPIERAFKDFANDIARHPAFEGAYTGNSPVAKPENYKSRAIPLERFLEILVSEINQHNDRAGREARACRGRSFRDTFLESYASAPITKATEEQRRLWLLAADGVTVNSRDGTVKLFDNRYFAEFLHLHRGDKVIARFDPEFLHDGLHIHRLDGGYLGHAPVLDPAGFDNTEAAQTHNRARKAWLRGVRMMAEAERRMSPEKVADLVPPNLGPAVPAEARVVQLARPTLDLKRAPEPERTDGQEQRHTALIAEFRRPAEVPRDERTERLEWAMRTEAAIAAGTATPEEAERFARYARQPEWKAHKRLAADFAQATA
ncbi:transposase domain-containing protein [Azospirillum halopraeferens]|uniref:transposase domain-containing protein n=1 Tax=Azospirillum halopraeferens TaxID=34010 RepID=UPI0003F7F009|nr:transposase domain-containing protein [Azospirillum halopraeferens]